MMNIKIILLLSLAAYVACGGGDKPLLGDGITAVEFSDDDDSEFCLAQAGEPSEPLNEDSEQQTPMKSQEPIKSNTQEQEVGVSGLDSSRSNTTNVQTAINYGHPGSVQINNSGYIYGPIYYNIKGLPVATQGDTLFVDGKEVQGVNATERPLVIEWDVGKLKVNGISKTGFEGIQGSGIWEF
ncbi:uncharacterized protein LOC126837970 isoform X2 [Adelges cooleyi]|uniref:uncharacterized protein LOC126837970 isoform X2 n=1 Tax=Adelges cooleyi TaxID=133065 RepID=UPI0021805666|nr:uncharacterized protein LOC126837970 isoform X2 [Adelges cooleyi]